MAYSTWVALEECDVLRITEKAMLVRYNGQELWLPLSQVADPGMYSEKDRGITVLATEWIVGQKGIEVE